MSALRIVAIAMFLLAGCAGEGGDLLDAGATNDSAASCDPALTYASFGAAFLATHCNGCHSWSQADAKNDGTVLSDVVTAGYMPPGGLTASQEQQFADWVACGAP